MKTFADVCAQGDIYIRRVASLPHNAVLAASEGGQVIVTHSETGHHHVMEADKVTLYRLPDSITDCLLVVNEPATLEHLRPFDTHEPILFQPGIYRVHRQREYAAFAKRIATDLSWRIVPD